MSQTGEQERFWDEYERTHPITRKAVEYYR